MADRPEMKQPRAVRRRAVEGVSVPVAASAETVKTFKQINVMDITSPTPDAQATDKVVHLSPRFPQERLLLLALLKGPVPREAADAICHTSNGPAVVWRVRQLLGRGVIITRRHFVKTPFGWDSCPGTYELAAAGRRTVLDWLAEVAA